MTRWLLGLVLACLSFPVEAHDRLPGSLSIEGMEDGLYTTQWIPPKGPGCRLIEPIYGPQCTPFSRGVRCEGEAHVTFANPAGVRVEVLVHLRRGERIETHRVTGSEELSFSRLSQSQSPWLEYVWVGASHVLLGWDHLAFVILLVLLMVTFRPILWALTGFTLGHSLTLSAGFLGWQPFSIQWVEVTIALSLVVLAAEILRKADERTLTRRFPALLSALFGLVHGFGFAAGLREMRVPAEATLGALFGFNLGVEVAQVIVVVLFLPLFFFARKTSFSWASKGERALAWGIGGLAALAVGLRFLG